MTRPGIFLDRDGVLIRDVDILTRCEQVELLPGAVEALKVLQEAGYPIVVVTNQPVVARGWITEPELQAIHQHIRQLLQGQGADVSAFYYCPHHPAATLPEYRQACDCRKPRPGLLLQAAADMGLDLPASVMVGDRISDIAAGRAAGCATVLVECGCHEAPPITSPDPIDPNLREDFRCADLAAAVEWILRR